MASLEDLKTEILGALETRGSLNSLKSHIRAEIFSILEETEQVKEELSDDDLIINELIREYLREKNLKHTLSVFLAESGQPIDPLSRDHLERQTVISRRTGVSRPLLYGVLRQTAMDTTSISQPQQGGPQLVAPSSGSDKQFLAEQNITSQEFAPMAISDSGNIVTRSGRKH